MATVIVMKRGKLDIERGLKAMNWDTEEFEKELETWAMTQPPNIQEQLRKQYNDFMKDCGMPVELVVVEEHEPKQESPKIEEQPEPKPASVPQETKALAIPTPAMVPQPEPVKTEEVKVEEPKPIPQEVKPNEPETEPKKPKRKELQGYLVMDNAPQVKNLLKALNVLVDEATFKLTPKGLTYRGMDPSRVAMVDLVIPRENCTEHSCPEEMKFCFDIKRFIEKTLKNVAKGDGIRLDVQTGIIDKMNTRLFGKLTRQFSMPLLEASEEDAPTPKIAFMYSAKLVLENVNTLFKDLEDGGHFEIIGTQDSLTFKEMADIEAFTCKLEKGDVTVLNIEAKQEAKATYSVSYVKEILKELAPLADVIEVSYSTDMPIRITAELVHLGTLSFYVAPRIETD